MQLLASAIREASVLLIAETSNSFNIVQFSDMQMNAYELMDDVYHDF